MKYAAMKKELRGSSRKNCSYPAHVDVEFGQIQCILFDMSVGGARLRFDKVADIPEEFSLLLTLDGKVRRKCKVQWRTEKEIGVSFIPTPPAEAANLLEL